MSDFEDELGEMIHVEIEAEIGSVGLEELKHHLASLHSKTRRGRSQCIFMDCATGQ